MRFVVATFVLALALAGAVSARRAESAAVTCANVGAVNIKTQRLERATVEIRSGAATCKQARAVATAFLSGRAKYHNGGYSYNSYQQFGYWRGGISTGAWGATNTRTHAYVGGQIL